MYIYIYTELYIYIYTYTHIYLFIYLFIYVFLCVCVRKIMNNQSHFYRKAPENGCFLLLEKVSDLASRRPQLLKDDELQV